MSYDETSRDSVFINDTVGFYLKRRSGSYTVMPLISMPSVSRDLTTKTPAVCVPIRTKLRSPILEQTGTSLYVESCRRNVTELMGERRHVGTSLPNEECSREVVLVE